MPLQATSGAASYDGFGGGVAAVPQYIEDVFSTYLYTGTGASQTITNGIDLAGQGGLVWMKARSGTYGTGSHTLIDTARGVNKQLFTNSTAAQYSYSDTLTAFNSTGFTLGADGSTDFVNANTAPMVSWTFRKQPKFFDVVTYTGTNGVQTINHSLGSAPGCIIVKSTSTASQWNVYHRSLGATQALKLQATFAASSSVNFWNDTEPTATQFTLGASFNTLGETYVAYLFAHDAGGFGLTGTDNVISCGSYVGTGAVGNAVTLGYEPQWLMVKNITSAFDWIMYDNMRGMPASATNTGETKFLRPNTSDAEAGGGTIIPTATGFQANTTYQGANFSGETYIYIAIRRGPMKVPTTGTSVFAPVATSGNPSSITAGFPVDFALGKEVKNGTGYGNYAIDRLRGGSVLLETNTTGAEYTSQTFKFDSNTQFLQSAGGLFYGPSIYWLMRRAPGFFDEVCWTGDSTNPRSINHNLTVAPTLIITKKRNSTSNWITGFDFASTTYKYFSLNDTGAATSDTYASSPVYGGQPTASVFVVGNQGNMNISGDTYVSYLFATCAGVSKVGSYTGTGTTQTINCGFTAGARFVLIKRTDSTGDWYVWDSARGIVSGNDPYLLLNSTAAEVTSTDYIDTASTGFEISSTAPAAINASGGTFIFLAIA